MKIGKTPEGTNRQKIKQQPLERIGLLGMREKKRLIDPKIPKSRTKQTQI